MFAETLQFTPDTSEETLQAIPAKCAVFALRGHDSSAEPYVGKTGDLRRRLKRLLSPPEAQSKRLNLRERVATISYTLTGSDFESWVLLYRALRELFPQKYRDRIKLSSPVMIRIALENAYPRAYITRRLGRMAGDDLFYGPFPSHAAAEKCLHDSLDLFKLRRCVDDLHPDPDFPGCIYSEMKMCLAPCFKGCTDEAYAEEARRVTEYFNTRGKSLIDEVAQQRDRASEQLEFEEAAALHARIEKIEKITALAPELVHRIDELNALMVQPASVPEHVALFRISAGMIHGPALFPVTGMQHPNAAAGSTSLFAHPHVPEPIGERPTPAKATSSLESRIQECLLQIPPRPARSAAELGENLALLKRWFYKSQRFQIGEIFFETRGELPWRRIVRGVSRVYRGEREQPDGPAAPETHPAN